MKELDLDDLVSAARILVIDDDVFHLGLVERFLGTLGYKNIVTTKDPRQVMDLQFHHSFDLVLTDVDMPHMSGFDVIAALNSNRRKNDYLPVLVFTGHQERDVRIRALAAGAKDFLTKPLEPNEARHRIRNLLEVRILHNLNRREKERYEELLGSILPRSIIARLAKGESRIANRIRNASILFSDLVGFTTFSAQRQPNEVVQALTDIFSIFDELTRRHGLEKIKTIGDAYMVVGGLTNGDTDHALRAADLALDMANAVANNERIEWTGFRIRIGLHVGPIVAGLLGGTKSTYDVWGDTINTASRFENASLPGRINVSPAFAEVVETHFDLEPRGKIVLAGKGETEAYFLGPRRAEKRHTSEPSFKI